MELEDLWAGMMIADRISDTRQNVHNQISQLELSDTKQPLLFKTKLYFSWTSISINSLSRLIEGNPMVMVCCKIFRLYVAHVIKVTTNIANNLAIMS